MSETKETHTPAQWTWRNVSGAGIQISAEIPLYVRVGLHSYKAESDTESSGMLFTLRAPQSVKLADERWVQFCSEDWNRMQEDNARLITAAANSYSRHFGINAVQAAEDDVLEQMAEALRDAVHTITQLESELATYHPGTYAGAEKARVILSRLPSKTE